MPAPQFALPPQYEPKDVEPALYRRWLESAAFAPRNVGLPYVIVIPPPNVTAVLHMGHGMDDVTQDVLIRFERMRGRAALWLPGTDHAGIATQNVVEKVLAAEGKTRFDLGREAFVQRTWAFVKDTGNTILEQLKVIGSSCDWSRTRFTLSPEYSQAVREVFVRLWEEKLIYRGHRVIHWCPRCLTALSDEEAESKEITGKLYFIRYPVEGGPAPFLTVATTRPETLLGDTAVAVSPKDRRHRRLIGKTARLPLTGIAVPIVADKAVDPEFGTGIVKVTPAHDPTDFEIGLRHKLDMPSVIAENGAISGPAERIPEELRLMERFDARKRIVKMLDAQGLLEKIEPHQHAVRHCYRCDTIVEPRLSDQWFVKMKPLARRVMAAYRKREFRFVPERWNATFEHWMKHIRDWNISRQLWWGHRIPVFTCTQCKHRWAARQDPTQCVKCSSPVEQDPDVLDTWFSSWLWPFATFGWPQKTPDLKRFYPGHTLVTGPDILFFWVARMLMSGYHFMRRKPFETVFLHGIVRDTKHRKMSKSLGNGIDPLVVVEKFGADALRWTCIANTAVGQDLILDPNDLETTFAPGRNFANKLWNIGRFILSQLPPSVRAIDDLDNDELTLDDRWILSRTQRTIASVTKSFRAFRLDEAAKQAYEFVWNDLADWYVETAKPRLGDGGVHREAVQAVLTYCFDAALRLLHPIVPFITEALWQRLPVLREGDLLMTAPWPQPRRRFLNGPVERQFELAQAAVSSVRSLRAEYGIPLNAPVPVVLRPSRRTTPRAVQAAVRVIERFVRTELLHVGKRPTSSAGPSATAVLPDGWSVSVPLSNFIDVPKECARLNEELSRIQQQLSVVTKRLRDKAFCTRAPANVVKKEREREKTWRDQRDVLAGKLKALGCS